MPTDGNTETGGSDVTRPQTQDSPVASSLPGTSNGNQSELWLDQFARYLGFGRLAAHLTPSLPPSYLYAIVTVVGWTITSITADIFVFHNTPIYVKNPYFLLQPVVLIVGVHGAHTLNRSYLGAIDEMRLRERSTDPEQFRDLIPEWLPWAIFGIAAGLQLVRTYVDFAVFTTVGVVANGFVFPFVYAPIIVQFSVVYVTIEFILPWQLYRSDVGVHFLDPHGVGGLRPIGELVKQTYYYVVGGLIAYSLITYAPGVSGWGVSATAGVIFTSVWLTSIATVAFAVLLLHRFLHREKRKELRKLEAELHDLIEDPWDVKEYTVREDATDAVEDLRRRIDQVSSTQEYPATFSIWTQLLLSVAIPKALQLFLAGV
jgi:ABC-type multidrug transport system fused ATPase/permease subunit